MGKCDTIEWVADGVQLSYGYLRDVVLYYFSSISVNVLFWVSCYLGQKRVMIGYYFLVSKFTELTAANGLLGLLFNSLTFDIEQLYIHRIKIILTVTRHFTSQVA